jgi:DNA-binding XRE family transcriptional regulator
MCKAKWLSPAACLRCEQIDLRKNFPLIAMTKSQPATYDEELLALLRLHRQTRHLRQLDLAKLLGKSQATVSKVEKGVQGLPISELSQWLAALDLNLIDFMRELNLRLASAQRSEQGDPPFT